MGRMGCAHVSPQGGGYEAIRAFGWEIEIYGVPGQDILKMSAASFDMPSVDNEPIEIAYLNRKVKIAGQGSCSQASGVFHIYADQDSLGNILKWKKLVQDPENGNIGMASSYKKQADLKLLGPDGSTEKAYQLRGVWPSNVKVGTADYNNNGVLDVTVTLQVDEAIPQF